MAPAASSFRQRHGLPAHRFVGADSLADVGRDLFQLLRAHRRKVREVEPQPVVGDLGALLLGVLAEVFLERVVQDVGGGVGAADRVAAGLVDLGPHLLADRDPAHQIRDLMQHQVAVFLRVHDLDLARVAGDLAVVAHLAARFAIERGAVEHQNGGGSLG